MTIDRRAGGRWAAMRDMRRQIGLTDTMLYAFARVLSGASGGRVRLVRYHIVAQPLGGDAAPALRPDPKTRVEPVGPDSPLVGRFPRPPEVIAGRFRSGAVCLAATIDGGFAGYLWWSHGRYLEDEVRCEYRLTMPERSVWDFDVYVEPRYRLGRTLARLWAAAGEHLTQSGVGWTFSRISAFNPASLAAHARLGAVRCRSLTFLVLGPMQLMFQSRWPVLHLSVHDGHQPTVNLPLP